MQMADPATPPFATLVAGERLLHTQCIEFSGRGGLAWLTSNRIMVRAWMPGSGAAAGAPPAPTEPLQFQLPLSLVTGHQTSAPNNLAKLMLKINYRTSTAATAGADGAATAAAPTQSVILRFVGDDALANRNRWKEALQEAQAANAQPPVPTVKTEPGLAPAAATPASALSSAAPSSTAAPSAPSAAPSAAAPAAASAAPPARPAGVKRPHGAMSGGAAPAASPTSALSGAELQSQIQLRAALLARDPALQAVHAELVPVAVSEEEFWAGRSELLRAEAERQGGGGSTQRMGVRSAMASNIRPDAGCNVLTYSLDADAIHAIFLEQPLVHELYKQLVPHAIDEKTFWTKYFRSQYIHAAATSGVRDELQRKPDEDDLFARATAMQQEASKTSAAELGGGLSAIDLNNPAAVAAVAEVEQKRDIETKKVLLQRQIDPSVDLTAADLPNAVLQADPTKSSASSTSLFSNTTRSKKARAATELLQKFNRHGMLVLDSNLPTARNNAPTAPNAPAPASSPTPDAEIKLQSAYHSSLASSLELVELEREAPPSYNELPIAPGGFFQAMGRKAAADVRESREERERAIRAFGEEMRHMASYALPSPAAPAAPLLPIALPPSAAAHSVLLELTQTARGMNKAALAAKQLREEGQQQLIVFSTGNEADMLIPDQFRDELKKRYHTCNELFRHFWSSLQPRTSVKLQRVHAALDEQYRLLHAIRKSLYDRNYGPLVPLLNPLVASIEMCHDTYQKFVEKESKRREAIGARRAATPTNPSATPAASSPIASPPLPSPSPSPPLDASQQEAKRIKV